MHTKHVLRSGQVSSDISGGDKFQLSKGLLNGATANADQRVAESTLAYEGGREDMLHNILQEIRKQK
jgi:hypothetical protein